MSARKSGQPWAANESQPLFYRLLGPMAEAFSGKQPTSFLRIPLPPKSGRLYVSPMPFGPYDRGNRLLKAYQRKGVSHALVLVTDEELKKKARRDLLKAYEKAGISVIRCPFKDYTAPVHADITAIMPNVIDALLGHKMVIHCNAGVGRTGVLAACVVAQVCGCSGEEAIDFIANKMLLDLTKEQKRFVVDWVESQADPEPMLAREA